MPGRLRLDFVSPLPPVRSGIADYSVDLLPHLAARPEVEALRVMRLPGQPVADEVVARWRPVDAAETGSGGRSPLYQMGNNLYHEGVAELAAERPGVLVLHDLVLHHLLVERTLSRGVFAPYAERLEADHGWIGRAVATPRRWGGTSDAGLFALAAHRTLLRRQRGVLVHSAWAAGMLAEEDPELAVIAVPMGVPLPAAAGPPGGRPRGRRGRSSACPPTRRCSGPSASRPRSSGRSSRCAPWRAPAWRTSTCWWSARSRRRSISRARRGGRGWATGCGSPASRRRRRSRPR